MSQPDGINRYECPICHKPTDAEELLNNSGLCMRCDNEQQEVMMDNKTVEKEEEHDEID